MTRQLDGKVALVTGGGSGIGRATALAFARVGAKVIVADVNVEGGEETAAMVRQTGVETIYVHLDVSRASDVEAGINKIFGSYGRLDCACNNAGIVRGGGLTHEHPEEVWDQVISINLKGVWLCMKYEIPRMLAQGGGTIVNMASIAGLVGGASAAYTASKHGVVGLTKTAALEYAQQGMRINAVCPGAIRTPLLESAFARRPELEGRYLAGEPVGRFGTADEVAESVVWLCSDAASFITGHALAVDGGWVAQ